jgi:glycosyltransferase involved in cell wall biosynthesis
MNLLFLNSIEAETFGGMEEWIRLVASGLAARGHRVTVAGRPGSKYLERIAATTSDVQTLELSISGDFNPVTIGKLKRYIAQNKIEVVIVNFNKDVRLGGLAARLDGSCRVLWSVGLDITKNAPSHRLLTPRLIDGVIVPSQALKTQITKFGYLDADKVRVIPIGIPETDSGSDSAEAHRKLCEKYNLDTYSVVAVTSGRFVDQKGHVYLIEAAPEIVKRQPKAVFLLLGNGPLEAYLREKIKTLGVEKHFVFAGMLTDLSLELNGADLMVHPSIEEPFGIAILEGMRACLPVVASEVGGIPEVVAADETALLVKPRDPDALSAAAAELFTSAEKRRQLGRAGRARWHEHFRLDGMIDTIEQHLKQHFVRTEHHG